MKWWIREVDDKPLLADCVFFRRKSRFEEDDFDYVIKVYPGHQNIANAIELLADDIELLAQQLENDD